MFDDFETQVQIEEIIPEEYEDWLDSLIEEHAEKWLQDFAEEYATEVWHFEEDEDAPF
jgi:hypothetical protein